MCSIELKFRVITVRIVLTKRDLSSVLPPSANLGALAFFLDGVHLLPMLVGCFVVKKASSVGTNRDIGMQGGHMQCDSLLLGIPALLLLAKMIPDHAGCCCCNFCSSDRIPELMTVLKPQRAD
jgi:hypothetical protein